MDTSRVLLHFGTEINEYGGDKDNLLKISNNNNFLNNTNNTNNNNTNNTNNNKFNSQNDISLTTIQSSLPTYISHHLNYCLDNCSDRDLIKFIKHKSENNISVFRLWMKIIASTYIPHIEQENTIINEWYYHLLNINKTHIPNKEEGINNNTNDNGNYSGSEEEEHYSISTAELENTNNNIIKPTINNININNTKKKEEKEQQQLHTNNIKHIHIKQPLDLSNLLDLPSSWLLHLFCNYFSFHTLLNTLPLVCSQFRTLCSDPNVWKSIKFPITVIRNIYNNNSIIDTPPTYDPNNIIAIPNKNNKKDYILNTNLNTLYFESFLIRSCRNLSIITFEGSIEENDWNSWNHIMKILGKHSLRYSLIDTLFVRCRHISRRGYCWLQSLAYIPTIEHIHCAALSRSDDVQHMIYNFNNLKTLNVNILGPRHPNRNFHSHHRLALKNISNLIPKTVTEFAIPVSVQEDFVRECFSRMPLLENLDFFRLTTPHQNVDIDSWACCLSSDTIYHLANNCKNLKKCQLFVKCFKPKTPIWDSVKFLLLNCKSIHMLTIGMTESETLNGLQKILPPDQSNIGNKNNNVDDDDKYDKLSKRYFDQLKKVPFLRKRFRKFKKKTMKFPKFTIMWCLLT